MKRNFSLAALSLMLICSVSIGISGFTSGTSYKTESKINFNSNSLSDFGVADFGFFKQRLDKNQIQDRKTWVDAVDDKKPDNTNYQLIKWEQMHYHTKL